MEEAGVPSPPPLSPSGTVGVRAMVLSVTKMVPRTPPMATSLKSTTNIGNAALQQWLVLPEPPAHSTTPLPQLVRLESRLIMLEILPLVLNSMLPSRFGHKYLK